MGQQSDVNRQFLQILQGNVDSQPEEFGVCWRNAREAGVFGCCKVDLPEGFMDYFGESQVIRRGIADRLKFWGGERDLCGMGEAVDPVRRVFDGSGKALRFDRRRYRFLACEYEIRFG